jgi:hypothetical protein
MVKNFGLVRAETSSLVCLDVESLSLAKGAWHSIFESHLEGGVYRFPVAAGGAAMIIDQPFDGPSPRGEAKGTLQIKVTHAPK